VLPRGYDVSGRVVDQHGNAVAGATIWYADENSEACVPIATSTAGRDLLTPALSKPKPTSWQQPRGLERRRSRSSRIEAPAARSFRCSIGSTNRFHRVEGILLTLDGSTGRIEGVVPTSVVCPSKAAHIAWLRHTVLSGSERISQMPMTATSDASGSFAFGGLRTGTTYLVVSAPGYAAWRELCKVSSRRDPPASM
jgi:hypothetical protein